MSEESVRNALSKCLNEAYWQNKGAGGVIVLRYSLGVDPSWLWPNSVRNGRCLGLPMASPVTGMVGVLLVIF